MTERPRFRPARISTAAALAFAAGAVAWVFLDWWEGNRGGFFPLPWTAVAGTAALVVAVVAAGLPVRRWVRGDARARLDPLTAARTVVLAKAAVYGGAILAGWYVAQAVVLVGQDASALRSRFVLALVGAGCAVGISVAGLVVQRWCRVPSDPSGPGNGGSAER